MEETGYEAQEWTRLCVIDTAIGYTDERIELFLARKLIKKTRKLDPGEFLEIFLLPFDDAVQMVRDNRISDVKTIAAILWAKAFLP